MAEELFESALRGLMNYYGGMLAIMGWLMDRANEAVVFIVLSLLSIAAFSFLPTWGRVVLFIFVWAPALAGSLVLMAAIFTTSRRGER